MTYSSNFQVRRDSSCSCGLSTVDRTRIVNGAEAKVKTSNMIWLLYLVHLHTIIATITGSQVSLFHYFQRLILDCTNHLIGPFLPLDRGNDDWQWRLLLWRIHHIKWVRIIMVSMFVLNITIIPGGSWQQRTVSQGNPTAQQETCLCHSIFTNYHHHDGWCQSSVM